MCDSFQNHQPKEPIKPRPTPDLPFQEVAANIFELDGKDYHLLVDYHSKFIEVDELKADTRSKTVIKATQAPVCPSWHTICTQDR